MKSADVKDTVPDSDGAKDTSISSNSATGTTPLSTSAKDATPASNGSKDTVPTSTGTKDADVPTSAEIKYTVVHKDAVPSSTGTKEATVPAFSITNDASSTKDTAIPTSIETKDAIVPSSTGTKNTDGPASTETKNTAVPASAGAKDSAVPTSTGTKGTAVPTSIGTKDTAVPTSTGTKDTAAPTSTGTKDISVPTSTETKNSAVPTSTGTKDTAVPASTETKNSAVPASTETKDISVPTSASTKGTTVPTSTGTKDTAVPASTETKNTAVPVSAGAKDTAVPTSTGTKDTDVPTSTGTKDTAVPTSTGTKDISVPTSASTKGTSVPPSTVSKDTAVPASTGTMGTAVPTSASTKDTAVPVSAGANDAVPISQKNDIMKDILIHKDISTINRYRGNAVKYHAGAVGSEAKDAARSIPFNIQRKKHESAILSGNVGGSAIIKLSETECSIRIQSAWRGKCQRKQLKRLNILATSIQKIYRGKLVREQFQADIVRVRDKNASNKDRKIRLAQIRSKQKDLTILSNIPAEHFLDFERLRRDRAAKSIQRVYRYKKQLPVPNKVVFDRAEYSNDARKLPVSYKKRIHPQRQDDQTEHGDKPLLSTSYPKSAKHQVREQIDRLSEYMESSLLKSFEDGTKNQLLAGSKSSKRGLTGDMQEEKYKIDVDALGLAQLHRRVRDEAIVRVRKREQQIKNTGFRPSTTTGAPHSRWGARRNYEDLMEAQIQANIVLDEHRYTMPHLQSRQKARHQSLGNCMSLIDELRKPLSLDDARDYIRNRHSSNKGVSAPIDTALPSWLEDRDLWTSNSKSCHGGDDTPDLDFKALLHNTVKAASTQHVTAFHALRNSDISHHSDVNSDYSKTHTSDGENKRQQKHWGAVALPLPLHVVTAPTESNRVAIDSSIRSSSEWKDVRSSLNKSIDDDPTNPAAAHLSQRLLTDAKLFKPLANQWASGADIEDSLYWIAYATQPSNRQPTSTSTEPSPTTADEDPTTRKYNDQLRQMIAVEAMSLPRRVPRLLEQVKRENERVDRLAAVIQHETLTFLRKERALYDKLVLGEEKSSLQHRAAIRIQAVARGRSARLRTAGMKANRRVLVALHNLLQEINISEGDRQVFPSLAFGNLSQLLQPSKPATIRSSQSMHSKAAAGSGLSAVNRSKIMPPLQSYDRPASYTAEKSISQPKYTSPMKGGPPTRPSTDYTDYNADSKDQDDGSDMRYNKIFHSAKSLTDSISRSNTAPIAAAAAGGGGYFSPMMAGLDAAPSSSRANTYHRPDNSTAKTDLSYGSLVPPIGIAPFSNDNTPRATTPEQILLESVPGGRRIQSAHSNMGSKPGIAASSFSPSNSIDIQQSADAAYLSNSNTTTTITTTIPPNPFSPNRRTLKLLSDNFSASDQLGDLPATFNRGSYNQDAGPMSVSFAPIVSDSNERLVNLDTNERRVGRLDSPTSSAMKGTTDQTTPGSNLSGYLSEFSSPLQDDLIGIGYISSPGHSHSYDNSNHSQSNEHSLSRSLSATFGQVAIAVPKGSPVSNMDRITQSRSLMQLMESKDDDDMSEYLDAKLITDTPRRPMAQQLNDTFRIYPSTPSAAESTFQQVKQVMELVQKRFQTDTCTVRGFISSALVADQRNFDKNASLRLLQSMVMVTGVSPLVQWLQLFRCLPHDEQEDVKKKGGSSSIIEQSPSASLVLGPGEVTVQDAALLIAELASELQLMDTSAGKRTTNEDEREREMMFNLIQTCILFKLLGAGTDSGLLRISELTGLLEDAWILAVPMNGVRISNMLAKLRFSVLQQATRKASRPRKLFDDVVTACGISINVSRNTNNPNPSSSSDDDALAKWYDEDRISAEDVEIIIEKLFINSNSLDNDGKSSSRTAMKSPSPTKSTKKSVYLELAKVLIKMSSWNDFSSFISILDLRNMLCSLCSFRVLQKRLQVWFRAVPSMHPSLLENLKQFDISHEDGYSTDVFLSAGLQSKIPLSQSELYMLAQLLIRKRTTGARISSGGSNTNARDDQDKSIAYVDVSLLKRVEVGDFLHAALV